MIQSVSPVAVQIFDQDMSSTLARSLLLSKKEQVSEKKAKREVKLLLQKRRRS